MITFSGRASGRLRTWFGISHFAKSLAWGFVDLLLAYYLIAVLDMPAAEASVLLFVLLTAGAVFDLLVGLALNAAGTSLGRILRLHLFGAAATAVTLVFQFIPLSPEAPVVLATGLLFRLSFALYDVPQNALTSMLPSDAADARRYVVVRATLGGVAKLVVTGANLGLAQFTAMEFRVGGVVLLVIFGAAMVVSASVLWILGGGAHAAAPSPPPQAFRVPKGLWAVLFAFAVSTLALATLSRLVVFSAAPPDEHDLGAWMLLAVSAGGVTGPWIALRLEALWGWRKAHIAIGGLSSVAGAVAALQMDPGGLWFRPVVGFLYGLGLGGVGAFLWEAATRVAMRHAAATGQRADGLVFGAVIFVIQISIALGALVLGRLVEGFAAGEAATGALTAGLTVGGAVLTIGTLLRQRTGPAEA